MLSPMLDAKAQCRQPNHDAAARRDGGLASPAIAEREPPAIICRSSIGIVGATKAVRARPPRVARWETGRIEPAMSAILRSIGCPLASSG